MIYIWNLDPIAFSLLGLSVRWYGIAYVLGFFIILQGGQWLLQKVKKHSISLQHLSKESFENLCFGLFFSGILGGRIGLFLFYNPQTFWTDFWEIFKVWHGGMSIHGGILGAFLFGFFWCKKNKIPILPLADILIIPLALTLFLGRITNFLNGELVGIPTNQMWGILFPHIDELLRHPSQLYEAGKNLFLFLLLSWLFAKDFWKKPGFLLAVFLGGYGILRFLIEFYREPAILIGLLSMGQILCIIMILISLLLFKKTKIIKLHTKK
ncbi:prolipoprotein diacylglyceryl transferase [Candidatus Gracilibacteria bacterium]|nr:prolipoprotein diacylglyceryl transferase [Candidatus Gracilibacteria bacterium]